MLTVQSTPHPARVDNQQQPDGSKAKAASEHTPLKKKKSQKQKATPRDTPSKDTPIKRDALLEQAKARLLKKKKQKKKSKEQRDTPPKDTPNKSQAPEDNAEPATNSQPASPEEEEDTPTPARQPERSQGTRLNRTRPTPAHQPYALGWTALQSRTVDLRCSTF